MLCQPCEEVFRFLLFEYCYNYGFIFSTWKTYLNTRARAEHVSKLTLLYLIRFDHTSAIK